MTELANKHRQKQWRRKRAHLRIRNRITGSAERPRLAVFKSLRYVYAQLVDDVSGRTLVAASTLEPELKGRLEGSSASSKVAARLVGEVVAQRAKDKGIERVVFDRGGYVYHGKVRELAEAARENGLEF
jgi:large subunit ribosomal protein L18